MKKNDTTSSSHGILTAIGDGIEGYCRIQGIIGGWLLLVIAPFVAWGAIARYIFRMSVPGMLEIPSYAFLIALTLAAALTMKLGGHIKVTLLIDHLKQKPRSIIDIGGLFLSLIYCSFLCWACGDTAMKWYQSKNISTDLEIPQFPLMIIACLGFLVLCLQIIVIMTNYKTKKVENKPEE
jgi:TRAP-type C4-dicarboxylate transport system permease small subunit